MVVYVLGGLVATVAGVLLWSRARRPDRTVRDALAAAAATPLQFFPDGAVGRVSGTLVLDGEPLQAPLTGRACAAYEVLVERLVETGVGERWVRAAHHWDVRPFALDDTTGRAYVDPKGALLTIVNDHHTLSGFESEPDERQAAFLETVDAREADLLGSEPRLRYREGVLEPGERVALRGRGRVSHDDTADASLYRGVPRVRVDFRSEKSAKLFISDDLAGLADPAADDPA
ncbi:MAG: hypothetical protein AAF721_24645 [Myxococcota bacterium]